MGKTREKTDPVPQCCPHLKKQHRRAGFKPCMVAACPCRGWWKGQRLELAK